jgi:hypothetical protein
MGPKANTTTTRTPRATPLIGYIKTDEGRVERERASPDRLNIYLLLDIYLTSIFLTQIIRAGLMGSDALGTFHH